MTQSFRDMNQLMARLTAMLIKVRKADILRKKDEYIRKVYSGYRGAVISSGLRPYLPQYFPLYKSHTQGNSIAESGALGVAPFLVNFKRFQWGFGFLPSWLAPGRSGPSPNPNRFSMTRCNVNSRTTLPLLRRSFLPLALRLHPGRPRLLLPTNLPRNLIRTRNPFGKSSFTLPAGSKRRPARCTRFPCPAAVLVSLN